MTAARRKAPRQATPAPDVDSADAPAPAPKRAKKAAKKKKPAGQDHPVPEELLPAASGSPPRPDEMDPDVIEFITAIEEYKRRNRRPFPNWSEILEVVKSLGYARI